MNELLKATVRSLIEAVFAVVNDPGSPDDKANKLKRATLALAGETASEAAIRKGLG